MTSNQMNTKISLTTVIGRSVKVEKEDVASWILAVRNSKFFRDLPSDFDDFDIPYGTIPSTRGVLECYTKVLAYFKENIKTVHPVSLLEVKMSDVGVDFTPQKIVTDMKETFVVKKGYLMQEKSQDEVKIVASAFVSTALAYTVRLDKEKKLLEHPKEADLRAMAWYYPDLSSYRVSIRNYTRSCTLSQKEMYQVFLGNPPVALHMMSSIIAKKVEFGAYEKALDPLLAKMYDRENVKTEDRVKVMVPMKGVVSVMNKPTVDLMWKYLHKCRQIRGEDSAGIGGLTIGYYFFDMTRSIFKKIAEIYDIRAMLQYYGVDTVVVSSMMSEYVIKALILQGYWVVCLSMPSLKPSTDVPGFYSSVARGKSYVELVYLTIDRPDYKAKVITYPEINIDNVKAMRIQGDKRTREGSIVYRVVKLPLMPVLGELKNRIMLPSIVAHNGWVWVGPDIGANAFTFDAMVERTARANAYRNHYPFNRSPFWALDGMMKYFKFNIGLKLPKLNMAMKVKKDDEFLFDMMPEQSKIEQDVLTIDITAIENEVVPSGMKVKDFAQIIKAIKGATESEDGLRVWFANQYVRIQEKKSIEGVLSKLLDNYNWEDVYSLFGLSGSVAEDVTMLIDSDEEDNIPHVVLPASHEISLTVDNGKTDDDDYSGFSFADDITKKEV